MGNLKSWQSGQSGNPKGRPKGSRNFKTIIRDMLHDSSTWELLPKDAVKTKGTPLEAIICTLTAKAIQGDIRAADVLLKYAVDRDEIYEESTSIFDTKELVIQVVNSEGEVTKQEFPKLTEAGIMPGDNL